LAEINIERLTLTLSGLSERNGEHLVRLIAEGLASLAAPVGASRHVDAIQVDVTAATGTIVDSVADQIAAEVLRQLNRTV
jgi:hypothetical protein